MPVGGPYQEYDVALALTVRVRARDEDEAEDVAAGVVRRTVATDLQHLDVVSAREVV